MKSKNWESLGKKVKRLRKLLDVPVVKIVKELGITNSSNYFIYEKGKSHFTPEMIMRLSKLLTVDVEFLMDETKELIIEDYVGNSEKIIINQDKYSETIISFLKDYDHLEDDDKKTLVFLIKKIFDKKKSATSKENNVICIDDIEEILDNGVKKELNTALKNPKTRQNTIKMARRLTRILINNNSDNTPTKNLQTG